MIIFNIGQEDVRKHPTDRKGVEFSYMFSQVEGGIKILSLPKRIIVYNNYGLEVHTNEANQLVVPYGRPEIRMSTDHIIQLFINRGDAATPWGIWLGENVLRASPANTIFAHKKIRFAQRTLHCLVTVPQSIIVSSSEIWQYRGEMWISKPKT